MQRIKITVIVKFILLILIMFNRIEEKYKGECI